MKKFILLLILFSAFAAEAQYGYGNQQRRRQSDLIQTQEKPDDPVFKVEQYLGIVVYDIEKAAKKSSISLSSKEGKEFSKTLTEYNKDIKEITRINSFLLRSTKEMVENYQKSAMKSGDFSGQLKVQQTMIENLKPISDTLVEEDKKLDKLMKTILTEKHYKKWIKYNRKLYKVFPKEEE